MIVGLAMNFMEYAVDADKRKRNRNPRLKRACRLWISRIVNGNAIIGGRCLLLRGSARVWERRIRPLSLINAWWRDPALKETWGAPPGAPLDGVDAGTFVEAPDRCGKIPARALTPSELWNYAPLFRGSQGRESDAWGKFDVLRPARRPVVDSRWVRSWEVVDGRATVPARLAARASKDPDLRHGRVEMACCFGLFSPY